MRKPPKIYLTVPNLGSIRPELARIASFWISPFQRSYNVIWGEWPQLKPVDYARNVITEQFLKTDCTHILMIDADIIPPHNTPSLLDYEKEIIGGLCPIMINGHLMYTLMNFNGIGQGYSPQTEIKRNTLYEVDATGTGCLMVKREVFEQMQPPWFDYELEAGGTRVFSSEDYSFCRKAKESGCEIWVHTGYECGHVKEVDLRIIQLLLDRQIKKEPEQQETETPDLTGDQDG
jgi:hypothetical protein